MSDKNNSNKSKLNNKDKIFYLMIAMFSLNSLTNNEYFLASIVGFNFKIIIKVITLLLLIYLVISLISPLVKKIKDGLNKETVIRLSEYIFVVIFLLFMIYDINKIL